MWLGVLGPLSVRDAGAVPVPAAKQRAVLAALLVRANRVVSFDELADAVWDGRQSPGAPATIRNYVRRLRLILGPAIGARIVTRHPGYLIEVDDGELDLLSFTRLVNEGGAALRSGAWPRACDALNEAVGLWRGAALADIPSALLQRAEAPRLEGLRLQALEWKIEAGLQHGRHDELVSELEGLARLYPLRERFHAQQMLALYRCGRRAEALAVFQHVRRTLVAELGVEPGLELRQRHESILRADPGLAWTPASPVPAAAPSAAAGTGRPGGPVPRVPRYLPAATAEFTGRTRELEGLTQLLDRSVAGTATGITVISGTPGVGKTALAVSWAHRIADRFPDGQLYVNLRGFDPSGDPLTPGEAIRVLLDALEIPAGSIAAGADAQAGLLRSLLSETRTLIVLDNARDEQQVRPLLPASATCMVVVTSRNLLAGLIATQHAVPVELGALTPGEARELLARRLGPARTAAEPGAVAELADLCARLPLALAITAARAASRPRFPLAALAGELRAARLTALDTGDAASSVRTVFSWSYQSLTADGARMFRWLGLHPGPDISVPAAASLAGVRPERARELLTELSRAHLLAEESPGRFSFHDLLRTYAAEQAQATDSPAECRAAVRRMLDYYLRTAFAATMTISPAREPLAQAPPGAPDGHPSAGHVDASHAMGWLSAERHVLPRLVRLAAGSGEDRHAWQIAWCVSDFLNAEGAWQEWADLQVTAVAAARRLGDLDGLARAHRSLGRARVRLGLHEDADIELRHALELYQQTGDLRGQARTYTDIAYLAARQDNYHDALQAAGRSLALNRATSHRAGEANALNTIGWCLARLGTYDRARSMCEQALRLDEDLGNRRSQADTWDSLGYIHHHLGDYARAVACYHQALDRYREVRDRHPEAVVLGHLAAAYAAAGDPAAADGAWQQSLLIFDELHHPDARRLRIQVQLASPSVSAASHVGPADPDGC